MATFVCDKCGASVEVRCKPKKCSACGESGTMAKAPAPSPPQGKK